MCWPVMGLLVVEHYSQAATTEMIQVDNIQWLVVASLGHSTSSTALPLAFVPRNEWMFADIYIYFVPSPLTVRPTSDDKSTAN